jgi:hypothetical protein
MARNVVANYMHSIRRSDTSVDVAMGCAALVQFSRGHCACRLRGPPCLVSTAYLGLMPRRESHNSPASSAEVENGDVMVYCVALNSGKGQVSIPPIKVQLLFVNSVVGPFNVLECEDCSFLEHYCRSGMYGVSVGTAAWRQPAWIRSSSQLMFLCLPRRCM